MRFYWFRVTRKIHALVIVGYLPPIAASAYGRYYWFDAETRGLQKKSTMMKSSINSEDFSYRCWRSRYADENTRSEEGGLHGRQGKWVFVWDLKVGFVGEAQAVEQTECISCGRYVHVYVSLSNWSKRGCMEYFLLTTCIQMRMPLHRSYVWHQACRLFRYRVHNIVPHICQHTEIDLRMWILPQIDSW